MPDREKILSNDFMDIISDASDFYRMNIPPEEYFYQQVEGDFGIFYINQAIMPPMNATNFTYRAIPKLFALMQTDDIQENNAVFDPSALIESGILQVQRPPLSLLGSGVIIGFIDTGIRYTEDVFRHPDGSSRIMAIWDQTIQTGVPPDGLKYGSEYTKAMIDQALRTDDPRSLVPSWDDNGHGTAVASVAAGNALGGGAVFQGAAPDCQIVVVKCKQAKQYLRDYYFVSEDREAFSETDVILALKYIEEFGIAYRRPVVICFGMGSNLGGHAGGSPFSTFINRTAVRRSRIVVAGGGNEGNTGHHYSGSVGGIGNIDNRNAVEIQVREGTTGFIVELWGGLPNALSASIHSPGGERTEVVDFRTSGGRNFSFVYEQTQIRVDHVLVEQSTGDELFIFRFVNPTPGVWVIEVGSSFGDMGNDGGFNMWMPISAEENVVFLSPDPYTTLTGPANTMEILTVTTYNHANGSFYGRSGRGFTRIGEIKPDIAAPGVDIDTILGKMSGSSMSSAIAAGAAAQFMQWAVVQGNNSHVESQELRNYLILGARRLPELSYPNREWGSSVIIVTGRYEAVRIRVSADLVRYERAM